MRVHVVRTVDDLVVNTILVDDLPDPDAEHRYVACDGVSASVGYRMLSDGTVVAPDPVVDTAAGLAEQIADLQARLAVIEGSA